MSTLLEFPVARAASARDLESAGPATAIHVQLRRGEVHSVELEYPATLRVLRGSFWVTLEGDRSDYVVATGEQLRLSRVGLLVMEGLSAEGALEIS